MNPRIDEYIASLETPWQREACTVLRDLIRQADPEITEEIKWNAPYFEHAGGVTWMFCATDWVHFSFPKGTLLDAPEGTWEEGADTASKGKRTMKFRENQPIPDELIINLVKQAVEVNLQGKSPKFTRTKPGSEQYDVPAEYERILKQNNLYKEYVNRPYYQKKGWIQWVDSAKHPETRQKRINTMLRELQTGQYMPNKADRL